MDKVTELRSAAKKRPEGYEFLKRYDIADLGSVQKLTKVVNKVQLKFYISPAVFLLRDKSSAYRLWTWRLLLLIEGMYPRQPLVVISGLFTNSILTQV